MDTDPLPESLEEPAADADLADQSTEAWPDADERLVPDEEREVALPDEVP